MAVPVFSSFDDDEEAGVFATRRRASAFLPKYRTTLIALASGAVLLACVVVLTSTSGSNKQSSVAEEGALSFNIESSQSTSSNNKCDGGSDVARAIHASFLDLTKQLLALKGKMSEALKEDDCERVLELVSNLQRKETEFSSIRDEYENLNSNDQAAVDLCFEHTLLPTTSELQQYTVDSLSQCSASNPSVQEANALIDGANQRLQHMTEEVGGMDCVQLDSLMDEFSKHTSSFETRLAVIADKLASDHLLTERKVVISHADHVMYVSIDKFYEAWENSWSANCAYRAEQAFEKGASEEAGSGDESSQDKGTSSSSSSAGSADDDTVDHAAGPVIAPTSAVAGTKTAAGVGAATAAAVAGATTAAAVKKSSEEARLRSIKHDAFLRSQGFAGLLQVGGSSSTGGSGSSSSGSGSSGSGSSTGSSGSSTDSSGSSSSGSGSSSSGSGSSTGSSGSSTGSSGSSSSGSGSSSSGSGSSSSGSGSSSSGSGSSSSGSGSSSSGSGSSGSSGSNSGASASS